MKDDSFLYSGVSSASYASQQEVKKERSQEKKEKRQQLLPVGELVRSEIQKEIDVLQKIDYLNIEDMMSDEHFKAEMMARKKTIERLRKIQTRLNNILREPKELKPEAALTFGEDDE